MLCSCIFEWSKMFRDGGMDVEVCPVVESFVADSP